MKQGKHAIFRADAFQRELVYRCPESGHVKRNRPHKSYCIRSEQIVFSQDFDIDLSMVHPASRPILVQLRLLLFVVVF